MTISVVSDHISHLFILFVRWEAFDLKLNSVLFELSKLGSEELISFRDFILYLLPASFTADQVDVTLLLVELSCITNIYVISFKLLLAALHL